MSEVDSLLVTAFSKAEGGKVLTTSDGSLGSLGFTLR